MKYKVEYKGFNSHFKRNESSKLTEWKQVAEAPLEGGRGAGGGVKRPPIILENSRKELKLNFQLNI